LFGVTILGNNSALPAYDRHPTSQVVTLDQYQILIDCGEGTQMQLSRFKVRRSKIGHILISHLHGDHYFGLIGLITSMGLLGREQELHIFGPKELKSIIDLQLAVANTKLSYEIIFHALPENNELIYENDKFTIDCFQVTHRIPCWGFKIKEKLAPRKINRDVIKNYQLKNHQFEELKQGLDITDSSGKIISNDVLTVANPIERSYAYCADTVYMPSLKYILKNVSMLYHETTFLEAHEERATLRYHATTKHAGMIANDSQVHQLIIGHFSSKYELLDSFLSETKQYFNNTQLAIEGVTYRILHND
jgi:ribonuclease Z